MDLRDISLKNTGSNLDPRRRKNCYKAMLKGVKGLT